MPNRNNRNRLMDCLRSRRAIVSILVAVFVMVGLASPTIAQASTDAVLVMHFDEGSGTIAKDDSGYGNNGTIYGATWTTGIFGKALSFDGVDDHVEVPDSDILDIGTSDFSISLWYKANSVPKKDDGNGAGLMGKRDTYIANSVGYTFGFLEQGVSAGGTVGDGSGKKLRIDSSTFNTADNTFHYMVLACDRNGFGQIYVDGLPSGNPIDISSHSGSITNNLNLIIGAYYNSGHGCISYHFKGTIDEVRLHPKSMEPSVVHDSFLFLL